MKKAICIIRTSTDRQRIEEQRAEVLQMAYADGYTDSDIEVIGKCGASAIKLDDAYMENLNELYRRIESGDVAIVYAWAIDRIGRNEEVLMRLKNTLIKNKIQLVIKNPSLSLLNEDGSVNSGVEIAFSLFATMAKQEMEQKKQRFHRGKKQNAESGKFNGGTVPYGYDVDERGFFTLSEDSQNVRLAFELMASGKYTVATLTNELRARGVAYNGRLITYQFVVAMLKNTAYKGLRNKYAFDKVYPRIVSDELWEKAQQVKATNNSTQGKAKKHINLAALLIKCPDCGRSYISHGGKYVCSGYNAPSIRVAMGQDKCSNNIIVRQKHLDGALWAIAKELHREHSKGMNAELKAQIMEQFDLIKQKLSVYDQRKQEINDRYERIEDIYMSSTRMTPERYAKQIAAVKEDEQALENEVTRYKEEYQRLSYLLFNGRKSEEEDLTDADQQKKYDIVHRYITGVMLERAEVNSKKMVKIRIRTYRDEVKTILYYPNLKSSDLKLFYEDMTPFIYEPLDN